MDADTLAANYPRLFHMAEEGSWPLIQKYGLLGTVRLLREFEASEAVALEALGGIRKRIIEVTNPSGETAFIRDQLPLRLGPLESCLEDLSVAEWLGLLNGHVFFWAREERLFRLLNARAYRARRHIVLVLRTEVMLARYAGDVRLTSLNTGSTLFNPRPRGSQTFRTLDDFDFEERRRRAGRDAVVEIAVAGGVSVDPDLLERVLVYDGPTQVGSLLP